MEDITKHFKPLLHQDRERDRDSFSKRRNFFNFVVIPQLFDHFISLGVAFLNISPKIVASRRDKFVKTGESTKVFCSIFHGRKLVI